jgi:hypothetical protein
MRKAVRRRQTKPRLAHLAIASGHHLLRHGGDHLSAHHFALRRPIAPHPRSRLAGQIASDGQNQNAVLLQLRRDFPRRCRGDEHSKRNESGVHPAPGLVHVHDPDASMLSVPRARRPGLRVPDSNAELDGRFAVPRCSCELHPYSPLWQAHSLPRPPRPEPLPTQGLDR